MDDSSVYIKNGLIQIHKSYSIMVLNGCDLGQKSN